MLPTEMEWPAYMQGNLRRKAETLGLESDVELEAVTWVGPKRSFRVGGGSKPGAAVEVELSGAPETLRALWSWGLGQANSAGFGWVRS
ncbi:CRISPR-associated endoribonuclease Cas6 [Actinacidiphila yeochonensis]|uniref:CRISPR-associated endoribonuclease Cas6 n=1 Tax=Actinacidiphila yeochonensis TaxID=89050 RepID=UPI0018E30A1B|nr:CRISPR-associated endoribonuclease Cas6 [Actinacidiphila yeochonensis]